MRGLSLRTKIFFLFAGATLLTVLPALLMIGRAVENRVYERATEELVNAICRRAPGAWRASGGWRS